MNKHELKEAATQALLKNQGYFIGSDGTISATSPERFLKRQQAAKEFFEHTNFNMPILTKEGIESSFPTAHNDGSEKDIIFEADNILLEHLERLAEKCSDQNITTVQLVEITKIMIDIREVMR